MCLYKYQILIKIYKNFLIIVSYSFLFLYYISKLLISFVVYLKREFDCKKENFIFLRGGLIIHDDSLIAFKRLKN